MKNIVIEIIVINYIKQYINHKWNPLIYCCFNNKFEIVKLLVEKYKADINCETKYNFTSIMYSTYNNNIEITKYLFDRGTRLETTYKSIYDYTTESMTKIIKGWIKNRDESRKQNKLLKKRH